MDELGRLFLGDVRRRQTEGRTPPRRHAPGAKPDVSIDLTPEEFARMFGGKNAAESESSALIQAVIAPHLNGRQSNCVHQYARHLISQSAETGRVGLIELDDGELRVSCVESSGEPSDTPAMEMVEARAIVEALQEMNWDVRHWVLSIAHPRTPEARVILRGIEHWTLLATCDHDGVVGAYRSLKGLREDHRPQVTVAILDALEPQQAAGVFDKLSSVCRQFLNWPIERQIVVKDEPQAMEYEVFRCGGANLAAAWEAIGQFLAGVARDTIEAEKSEKPQAAEDAKRVVGEVVVPEISSMSFEIEDVARETPVPTQGAVAGGPLPLRKESLDPEVIDLPPLAINPDAMLEAILHHSGQWAQCVLRPPMCPEARLVVGRDRRLTLAAAASAGLANLPAIAQAYRWLNENRVLIGMAMPQFSIDPNAEPALRLFVDQNDVCAQALRPLLQSRNVAIQPYRRLRWGEKIGLLLEAA